MPQTGSLPRPFRIHARLDHDPHQVRIVVEASFEAAAVAYAEHMEWPIGSDDVSLLVHDLATGHEHSFRLHLDLDEMTLEN